MSDIVAFSPEHVSRLSGLSIRQLYYWDRQGLVNPEYADNDRNHPLSRIYSFRDLVALRTLSLLRKEHHISLQVLRTVGRWLRDNYDHPWSSLRFYVVGREILYVEPESRQPISASRGGQLVIPIEMEAIVHDVRIEANKLRERRPELVGQVTRNRFVVHNAPVISGTRIPTSAIWNYHSAGYSPLDILREYPFLTVVDIHAAIDFEENRRAKKAS